MAGTLTISTLSDGTNSTSSTNCIQGSAKAWVLFNGISGAVVRGSYNVSSVTRNGTGQYTVTLTNAIADANGASVANAVEANSFSSLGNFNNFCNSALTSTTTVIIGSADVGNAYQDQGYISLAVFR